MPEGPLVRKFHHLISPFVGQQVVKTGGSSKKLQPAGLQSLWLQDTQLPLGHCILREACPVCFTWGGDSISVLPGHRVLPPCSSSLFTALFCLLRGEDRCRGQGLLLACIVCP
uniref:Nei like DNA glycosylase 2 n=1 Tax=Macaca mulatta TaxID=9544 RepID=A0A5F8AHP7_MACMU